MARASKASGAAKKSKPTSTRGASKKKKTSSGGSKKATRKTTKKRAVTKSTKKRASGAKKAAPARATKKAAASRGTKKAAAKKPTPARSTKKAASRRSRKTRSPFDSRFLEQMRKLLVSERETYERQAALLKAEADSLVADIEPGDVQFDEESGEGDTIAVERGRDLALSAKALEMIEEIDHALTKFDTGSYGICEVSGEPIPKERLEAIPWARERVEYKVGGFGRR